CSIIKKSITTFLMLCSVHNSENTGVEIQLIEEWQEAARGLWPSCYCLHCVSGDITSFPIGQDSVRGIQ
uniref:Uncharacterized protein n=1 Tax=Paramormyrops kingsleyae TaxID=1676925 RepID=A0A3B3SQB1_9TELE